MLDKECFPVLPLIETVAFPGISSLLGVGRKRSLNALAKAQDGMLLSVLENKSTNSFYQIGTVGRIFQSVKIARNQSLDVRKVCFDGLYRAKITKLDVGEDIINACIERFETIPEPKDKIDSLFNVFMSLFEELCKLEKNSSTELLLALRKIGTPEQCIDFAASYTSCISLEEKQQILAAEKLSTRINIMTVAIKQQIEVAQIEKDIHENIVNQINEQQRRNILREKLKAVQKALGEYDQDEDIVTTLSEKISKSCMPTEVEEVARNELRKLRYTQPTSPESTVIRNYLDWLIAIPWNTYTKSTHTLLESQKTLDASHYGLQKVKDRILEYIAVSKRINNGQILCLTGPPGVGKTSLVKSMAEAMGKKLARVALGGVKDPSEIRGHLRTYIGAMPGKIIQALRKAKSMNPVILLDEIDKVGSHDFRGDPSAALLEVLDAEQNAHFKDHYMDVGIDISKVVFVATSNTRDIPEPLLDRLEIIEIPSYTHEEKREIALNHLVPNALKLHGSSEEECKISECVVSKLIDQYTNEAGVRQLNRENNSIVRKVVYNNTILADKDNTETPRCAHITQDNLHDYVGYPKYFTHDYTPRKSGYINGLAWTKTGGVVLPIQAMLISQGKNEIIMTGNLGRVMQESIKIGTTLVKDHLIQQNSENYNFDKMDLHIHVPEGAISKDGPSAGIAIASAIASLCLNKIAKPGIAMTGELDLHGNVLPVGGVKEKLLAASKSKMHLVLIPEKNHNIIHELPKEVLDQLSIKPVATIEDVWSAVF